MNLNHFYRNIYYFFLKIKIIEYKINTHTHIYRQTWQEIHKYQIMLCMKNTKKKIG